MRPREHPRGLILVEQGQAHEEPEHGAAERFRQPRGVMDRPRDERPVRPEPAVGDEQVQMRMPVGARAMRLETRDDANGEVALPRQRANRGRADGAVVASEIGGIRKCRAIEFRIGQSVGPGV